MTPIISVRDLVVEYDGRRVLNGLNLDIEHGETVGCWAEAVVERALCCAKSSGWRSRNPAVSS